MRTHGHTGGQWRASSGETQDQNSNQDSIPLSSQKLVCGHLYALSSSLHIGDHPTCLMRLLKVKGGSSESLGSPGGCCSRDSGCTCANRPGGFMYVVWMSALGGPEQAGDCVSMHVTVSACVCLSTDVCV